MVKCPAATRKSVVGLRFCSALFDPERSRDVRPHLRLGRHQRHRRSVRSICLRQEVLMSAVDRPTDPEWDLGKLAAAVKNGKMSPQQADAEMRRLQLRGSARPAGDPRPDRSAARWQVRR